jgi:quinol monooxygenase YgiN
MRKSVLSLTLLALAAGGAATALAQGMPTTQPKFLHIYREQVKAGRAADHSRWEAGWPAAFEKAKFPDTYIALESVTGPTEVLYISPYASQAAYGESMARQNADPVLSAETERLSRGDAEFVSEINAIEAVARPDLSHGAFPDLAMMRFWEITTFRVKPGHGEDFAAAAKAYASASARSAPGASWRTYQVVAGAPDGTYLVMSSYASFADFDKAATESEATFKGLTFEERSTLQKFDTDASVNTVTNRFRLDPRQSYVPAETRQKDPAFWMPKAPAKPAAAPKKKP